MKNLDLSQLIDDIETPVAVWDDRGIFVYLNEAFAKLFGYEVDEILGTEGFFLFDKKTADMLPQYHQKVFNEPVFFESFRARLWQGLHKDGDVISLRMRAKSQINDKGQKYRIAIVQNVIQAENMQVQKLESLGRMAGGVAHEINNLLQPGLLLSETLMEKFKEDEDSIEALKVIYESNFKAREIVRDILVFTREEETRTELLSLSQTVEQSLVFLSSIIPVEVIINTDPIERFKATLDEKNHDRVWVDKNAVTQIIANLVNNAIDAMNGRGCITLNIEKERIGLEHANMLSIKPGRYLNFQFSDDGEGMKPEILASVFEPFFTTKKVGEGTGLGLSVVYGIIRSWHGSVRVESEVGIGTTFSFYIPQETD